MARSNTLDKAKSLLAFDRIEECLEVLLELISKAEDQDRELQTQLTIYSASLQRTKLAYRKGLIQYSDNSRERNILINGIMENIHEMDGFGLNPSQSGKIFIIDKDLLAKQLDELNKYLEDGEESGE